MPAPPPRIRAHAVSPYTSTARFTQLPASPPCPMPRVSVHHVSPHASIARSRPGIPCAPPEATPSRSLSRSPEPWLQVPCVRPPHRRRCNCGGLSGVWLHVPCAVDVRCSGARDAPTSSPRSSGFQPESAKRGADAGMVLRVLLSCCAGRQRCRPCGRRQALDARSPRAGSPGYAMEVRWPAIRAYDACSAGRLRGGSEVCADALARAAGATALRGPGRKAWSCRCGSRRRC